MNIYVAGIEFITEECCECHMAFAMTRDYKIQRLKDHKYFYCPKGHQQYYTGKSDEQKLRDKLDSAEQDLEVERACCTELKDEVQHRDRQIIGHKGAFAKIKNKLQAVK